MSTRDDSEDHEGSKPVSFALPLRAVNSADTSRSLPVHDRRYEAQEDEDDTTLGQAADRGRRVADPVSVAADRGADPVRVRHRARPVGSSGVAAGATSSTGANAGASANQASLAPRSSNDVEDDLDRTPGDDPAAPAAPGVQVSDAPTSSRVSEAVKRAQRHVRLNNEDTIATAAAASPRAAAAVLQEIGGETDDEFDRRFIEDARKAFGEGFIPATQLPGDIGDRVRHISLVAGEYAKDFILEQLERMIVARVPTDTIASRFRVSTQTIYQWRKQLRKRYASRVRELRLDDAAAVIGEQLSQFELRISMGMQLAQKPDATLQQIRAGLEIAERAHTNMLKYHEMLGYYQDAPLAKPKDVSNADDEHVKKAKQVTNALEELFGGMLNVPGDDEGAVIETEYTSQVG